MNKFFFGCSKVFFPYQMCTKCFDFFCEYKYTSQEGPCAIQNYFYMHHIGFWFSKILNDFLKLQFMIMVQKKIVQLIIMWILMQKFDNFIILSIIFGLKINISFNFFYEKCLVDQDMNIVCKIWLGAPLTPLFFTFTILCLCSHYGIPHVVFLLVMKFVYE